MIQSRFQSPNREYLRPTMAGCDYLVSGAAVVGRGASVPAAPFNRAQALKALKMPSELWPV